ncbi:nucleotidyltransferase family protein [Deltaproteobacteria bacterium OttesenSCG-928-K17]|nr:nucleotidyltransferase family protein [Deltaproteobacteria bacterium OttesenSCG-928-K17]
MSLPIAILAGGLATRMRPATEKIPKALLDVNGRPFIDHQLRLLADHGLDQVVLCTGFLGEQVENYVGDGSRFGLKVAYSSDWPELLGTGGALKKALPLLGDVFMVLYGDSYLEIDYQAVARAFAPQSHDALMTVYENHDQLDASNVLFKDGRLMVYSKKNKLPDMRHVDYGLQVLKSDVLKNEARDKFDLADCLENLSAAKRLAGWLVDKRFYEIGSVAGLDDLRRHLS